MGFILDFWLSLNKNRHVRKITGSKVTGFYAALSVCYCAIQIICLAATWQVNHGAGHQLEVIVEISGLGTKQFSHLDYRGSSPSLRLCLGGISQADHEGLCPIIWPKPSIATSQRASGKRAHGSAHSAAAEFFPSNSTIVVQPYNDLTFNGKKPDSAVTLGPDCLEAIKWPYHHLLLLRREDVVAACFHCFLLVMSFTALLTESIPHIWTSFALHVIALVWSALQIWATQKFDVDYHLIITGPQGACPGIDLISGYFQERGAFQIATIVINFVSVIASGFLCWKLFGMYGWLTFKKMGASRSIARAYKCALALSVCIQLEFFYFIASVMCFVDQIIKRLLGSNPPYRTPLLIGYTITSICLVPWLYMAVYGIRRENKKLMSGFFILSVLYLAISGTMFISNTFRRTFEYWFFISVSFLFSWTLLVATIILAAVCTYNFGNGLPYYFERRNGEEADDYSDDFHPSPDEKNDTERNIAFPSASSDDAVIIAFPSHNSPLTPIKRSESAFSHMSQESRGSTRLPPLQVANDRERPRVVIPPLSNVVLSRNLTATTQSQAAGNSSFSPSWSPRDDSTMMTSHRTMQYLTQTMQMRDGLDRDFSFGTQASSDIVVPISAPQRSLSKASVASTSSTYSYGGRKKIDLGDEL